MLTRLALWYLEREFGCFVLFARLGKRDEPPHHTREWATLTCGIEGDAEATKQAVRVVDGWLKAP